MPKWPKLALCAAAAALTATMLHAAGGRLSATDFMARVRRPAGLPGYARMFGTISHLRRGSDVEKAPVYFGVMMNGERRLSQLNVGKTEGYRIGQSYVSGGEGTTVTPLAEGGYPDSIMARFGVKPEDLAMAFLYWHLEGELKPVTFRTAACRVFKLRDPQSGEVAVATVAEEYFFPLKVEFHPAGEAEEGEPTRAMEVEKFEETSNGFWAPTQFKLQGAGWRTRVEFSRTEAGELDPANPPVNIFDPTP